MGMMPQRIKTNQHANNPQVYPILFNLTSLFSQSQTYINQLGFSQEDTYQALPVSF